MVLIAAGAFLAVFLRRLMNPNTTYENARALVRVSRGSGRVAAHARMAIRGFLRGGMDEVRRTLLGAEEETQPLLREIEMVSRGAGFVPFASRSYASAEEGFAAGLEEEAVSTPWLAPFLAAGAAAAGALESEHHRHGIIHDLVHPVDAMEDVWHGVESAITGLWDKLTGHKRPTPEPDAQNAYEDDFSGIQYTFYDPPTGRIIGYKGIRRFNKRLSKKTTGKRSGFVKYDLDSARPISRIRPE